MRTAYVIPKVLQIERMTDAELGSTTLLQMYSVASQPFDNRDLNFNANGRVSAVSDLANAPNVGFVEGEDVEEDVNEDVVYEEEVD